MGKMSDRKGKSYENRMAKLLSKWTGLPLIRTPMSGAWSGSAGDIVCKGQPGAFPFTVECKKTESWDLHQLLAGTGPFFNWMEQVVRESHDDMLLTDRAKYPVLLFTKNYRPDYIAIPLSVPISSLPISRYIIVHTSEYGPWCVADFNEFTAAISYQDYIRLNDI